MAAQNSTPPQAGRSSHPFRFVPVRPELAVTDTAVGHDSLPLNESLLSGELQCTIKALTPLHVGWKQTEHDGRKLITPLTLGGTADQPGPVLIPGSTLHGMLRHALGSLLSAPMERVAERTASFRPNAQFPLGAAKWTTKAAIVVSRSDGKLSADSDVQVEVIEDIQDVALLRQADLDLVLTALGHGGGSATPSLRPLVLPAGTVVSANWLSRGDRTSQLVPGGQQNLGGCILLHYETGIDGQGLLAESFRPERRGFKVAALVRPRANRQRLSLPAKALSNLLDTLEHLGSENHGHLRDHPALDSSGKQAVAVAITALGARTLSPGDLVFLEVKHVAPPVKLISREILHILPTFRWRVRYRDTVHLKGGLPRAELMPLATELAANTSELNAELNAVGGTLSGARLLFGFNADVETRTAGIGTGNLSRLAGRIAANFAVEHDAGRQKRFVSSTRGLAPVPPETVALRPQAGPKATAPEHYVAQSAEGLAARRDRGSLVTWGDSDEQITGDLGGRKFYLHQPDMADEGNRKYFEFDPAEDNQAAVLCPLLRWVSIPGAEFRFSLKFRNLRPWELGAVLFALAPTPAAAQTLIAPATDDPSDLQRASARASQKPADTFAHKLGRGRAYGLGSVQITVSGARVLERNAGQVALEPVQSLPQWTGRYVRAFRSHVEDALGPKAADWRKDILANWLDVLRFEDRHPVAGYPSGEVRPADSSQEILNYHTGVRALHLKGRKSSGTPTSGVRYGILPEPNW